MQQPLSTEKAPCPPEGPDDLETIGRGSNRPLAPTSDVVTSDEVDPSQDGIYSWICVVCVFLLNMHTFGINGVQPLIFEQNWFLTLS